MNWGWKIAIVYTLFAGMMLTLVYKATQEDYALVTTDYYAKEKAQQGKIDAAHQVIADNAQIEIIFRDEKPVILFPESSKDAEKQIEIYCAYKPEFDQTLNTTMDTLTLPVAKGRYQIKSSWTVNNKKYYQEKELVVR